MKVRNRNMKIVSTETKQLHRMWKDYQQIMEDLWRGT